MAANDDVGASFLKAAGHQRPAKSAVKYVTDSNFADPDAAARKLVEIANAAEAVQDGRIYTELVNAALLAAGGSPAEFRAGIGRAVTKGWLWRHESGSYVKFTTVGAELFA